MAVNEADIQEFVDWAEANIKGDEKGEAQIFLDHLFRAYGLGGVKEAGATCEWRLKVNKSTKFADLLWPKRVLIEMKKRGENLSKHFTQAKTYWDNSYKDRPKYVVLCNFDEFWIYDWNEQRDPVDTVPLKELPYRWKALMFLVSEVEKPMFGNSRSELTRVAADRIIKVYQSLIDRKINQYDARRFTLQCLVCMFAEDTGMYPDSTLFTSLINECLDGKSTYDLFTGLFRQMASKEPATGGRFKDVPYFNGGLFTKVTPIELNRDELVYLSEAARSDWSKVEPSIFGSLFEGSLNDRERHVLGAHYTTMSEIMAVVEPTVLRPWRERIKAAKTLKQLEDIHDEMGRYKVLDPACGSGNFLYVAYRELKHIEMDLVSRMIEEYPSVSAASLASTIKCNQFYGIELNSLGVELAKITLSMAKKLAADDFNKLTKTGRLMEFDAALPFDDLDANFQVTDALFTEWPEVDAIIGNPPYQSKNKMLKELGAQYLQQLRDAYPEIPGHADYCVYWFRKAHKHLKYECRAGLVGTNTIRQTNSRVGGLDYIVANDGVITDAISTMPWSGDAAVYVSIVNWIKTKKPVKQPKKLMQNVEGKEWEEMTVDFISSSLSEEFDVSMAKSLKVNKSEIYCAQGQTHGHAGFLLTPEEAKSMISKQANTSDVIFPFLNADDLISTMDSKPTRYAIDLSKCDSIVSASVYKPAFEHIQKTVLPTRRSAFEEERNNNEKLLKDNPKARLRHHHEGFLKRWWQMSYPRPELMSELNDLNRYIVCGQVTKRPIFEFISTDIHPNAALMVFPMDDDYSFGILQSSVHWDWFNARCSTLEDRPRYTSTTVFDSFPWPQWGFDAYEGHEGEYTKIIEEIAEAARDLRQTRRQMMEEYGKSLRDLYRLLEEPGKNPLKPKIDRLNKAVFKAYSAGFEKVPKDSLELLYNLNKQVFDRESKNLPVFGPGIPLFVKDRDKLVSDDCVKM